MATNVKKLVVEVDDTAKTTSGGIDSVTQRLEKMRHQVSASCKQLQGFKRDLENITKAAQKANNSSPGANSKGGGLGVMDKLKRSTKIYGIAKAFSYATLAANKYIETMNLFDVVMGEASGKANEFNAALEGLGVNREESMRYQASFYDLAKSLGMSSKNAYTLSEQFTKLSYDYASLYNMSPDAAFQKLQAAAVGTVEPIRRLGKDISLAHLQEVAYNLGIQESVRNMTQAERATLRFVAVMQQSGAAMNDMERTINSPANQIRVLRAQFQALAREIGALVIPALNAILPVAIAVARVMRDLIAAIAALFGVKLKSFNTNVGGAINNVGSGLGVASNNAGDLGRGLGGAGKQAKKLKDYLLGIDELNVLKVDDPTGGAGGGGGGAGGIGGGIGGGDLGLDLEDFGYKTVLEQVKSKADEIYETFKKWEPVLLTIGGILATIWGINKLKKFGGALKGLMKVFTVFKGVKGIGGLAAAFFGLAGQGGILGTVATAFVGLGDKILMSFGIVSGSAVAAGGVAVAALGGIALAAWGVHEALSPCIEQVDMFGYGISDATENKLKPFLETMNSLDTEFKTVDWGNKVITDKDVAIVQEKASQLRESLLAEIDADHNQELADIELMKAHGVTANFEEIEGNVNKFYDDMRQRTEEGTARINEIYARASADHRELTQGEREEIKSIQEGMKADAINVMTESEEEQTLILQRLKYNSKALTVQQGSEILMEAKKNQKEQLQNAEDTHARMLAELDNRYSTEESRQSDAYKNEKKAIEELYTDMQNEANGGWDEILKGVKENLGEESKYIDEENGKIKTNWTVFWEGMGTKASETWKTIKENWNGFWADVNKVFSTFGTELKKEWNKEWESLKTGVQKTWDKISKNFNTFLWGLGDLLAAPFKEIERKWNEFWGGLKPKGKVGKWLSDHGLLSLGGLGDEGVVPSEGWDGNYGPTNVQMFARGGFVKPGSKFVDPKMFTAGEAGQELIGSYKSKRTVMPLENTSFVNAIHEAVYRATIEANERQQPVNIQVQPQVKIGNKDIQQASEEYTYDTGGGLIRRR